MTDENKRRNVADELARMEQAARAARALLDLGLHADAVSRAYYAVPSHDNRVVGGLQRARELADYDAAVVFTDEDARAEVEAAERFLGDALAFLRREGWIS